MNEPEMLRDDWLQRSRLNHAISTALLALTVLACGWGLLGFPGLIR